MLILEQCRRSYLFSRKALVNTSDISRQKYLLLLPQTSGLNMDAYVFSPFLVDSPRIDIQLQPASQYPSY
jgi:hypothetical protein